MYIKINNKKLYVETCSNIYTKFKGFMFTKNINYGKRFKRCNKIHTFFMKDTIDIFMTDKNNKITFIQNNVKKNKIIFGEGYYTYEIPKGLGKNLKLNDYIEIEK